MLQRLQVSVCSQWGNSLTNWKKLYVQDYENAKQLRTRNKQFNIIFHIEGDTVIVDKIIASKMIIN